MRTLVALTAVILLAFVIECKAERPPCKDTAWATLKACDEACKKEHKEPGPSKDMLWKKPSLVPYGVCENGKCECGVQPVG
uniref:Uncharacterized protein n=1 Tax=Plectus sambesii TaxID=2011161 RepID=A0A914X3Z6_9BILA